MAAALASATAAAARLAAARPALASAAAAAAAAAVPARAASWLTGAPPKVDAAAGTVAAFYYGAVRGTDAPSRNWLVAPAQDVKMNIGEFDKQVYAYARGFQEGLDLKAGDKVVLYGASDVESLVVQLAATLTGATTVVVDPRCDVATARAIVAAEGARAFIFSPRHGAEARLAAVKTAFAEELQPFVYGAAAGYEQLASKALRSLKWIVQTGFEPVEGVVRLKDLPVYGDDGTYTHDSVAAAQHGVRAADAVTAYYAPGAATAGRVVTHGDTLATAAAAAKAAGLTTADVVTVVAPLYTHFGYAAGALAAAQAGASLVLPGKGFDAGKTVAALAAQRATVVVATAPQFLALAGAGGGDALKTLRAAVVLTDGGAAALPTLGSAKTVVLSGKAYSGGAPLS